MKKINFLSKREIKISKSFSEKGYYIFEIKNKINLTKIRNFLSYQANKILKSKNRMNFDNLHDFLKYNEIVEKS